MQQIKRIQKLLQLPPETLQKQCKLTYFQASGPGGQKRNRKLSAVRLTHNETGLSVTASEYRETARNLADAVQKLRIQLVLSLDLEEAKETSTDTPLSKFRATANENHPDFPGSLLEAYHKFYLNEGGIGETAKYLKVSSSALIKFFKKDKNTWRHIQDIRQQFGHYPLK